MVFNFLTLHLVIIKHPKINDFYHLTDLGPDLYVEEK
jgi:hypothetical protein